MYMKEIPIKTFLYHFCNNIRDDKKYCFLLGAGASKLSGIPTGGELVQKWMTELTEMYKVDDLDSWKKKEGISMDDLAKDYSKIFDKRFELDKKEGFSFLEQIMEGKEPSCGYSVLAQILDIKPHKIVITTNFDSLTEDALFIYTNKKPLVVGHEALANYIKPFGSRPIIVKIHRDLFLTPKNTPDETFEIETNFKKNLTSIFKYYTPLVIGYGGNDGSLMGFLEDLDEIEGGIFWFYRENNGRLSKRIKNLIEKFDGYAIPIPGFDDLMIQIGNKLELERLDEKIVKIAKRRAKNYREQIKKVTEKKTTTKETKDAVNSMVSRGVKNWWSYEVEASKEEDLTKRDTIYQEGIKIFPKSAELHCSYAIFLADNRKEYDRAEEFFKKAIELNPDLAINIGIYANFLTINRKEYDKAEELFKKAIELDPDNANNIGNYAIFIKNIRKKYDKAEEFFKKAIELDPGHANNIDNYAIFLSDIRKEYDKAEKLFKKAIELEPDDANYIGNYAIFLNNIQKKYDEAEELYKKAIKLDPDNAKPIGNYALFLDNIRKEYDKAEGLFKKAIELDPDYANYIGGYALFLDNIRKEYDKAEELFKKAIELDPDDANCIGNYANLLYNIRKEYDKAEELYKKAIELDPDNAQLIGNYAIFLYNIRKKYDESEELFKKAIELDPDYANYIGGYANLLCNIRKEYDKAEELYKKAIELDPDNAQLVGNYANFLFNIRKEYDKAEELYKKTIELDPDIANNIGNYALFLSDIRKEYDKAEELYKKTIELDPDIANNIGNYAKHLIVKREIHNAKKLILKAFELNKDENEDLSLELWFYRYAIFFDEYKEAKKNIAVLLKKGIKSPEWYLDEVLVVAKELRHPDYKHLCELEKKITSL
jgi:protein O-mannosyl-transferase